MVGDYLEAGAPLLASPIGREIRYWDPDVLVSYDGPMWELSPVEVRSRPAPPVRRAASRSPPTARWRRWCRPIGR